MRHLGLLEEFSILYPGTNLEHFFISFIFSFLYIRQARMDMLSFFEESFGVEDLTSSPATSPLFPTLYMASDSSPLGRPPSSSSYRSPYITKTLNPYSLYSSAAPPPSLLIRIAKLYLLILNSSPCCSYPTRHVFHEGHHRTATATATSSPSVPLPNLSAPFLHWQSTSPFRHQPSLVHRFSLHQRLT